MPPSAVSARLSRITTGLAPTLDTLAAGIHDIELYRSTADAVSSRILRICAQRLEERDALNTQQRLAIEGDDSAQRAPNVTRPRPREDLGLILGALSRVERR
jgi:kinetochore protein Mis13/DSN1